MGLYELEWKLDSSIRKWIVTHTFGTVHAAANDVMSFQSAGVKKGASDWCKPGTYKYDRILEKVTGTIDGTTKGFAIRRANCLICTLGGTAIWIALQWEATDVYARDWELNKKWRVVASADDDVPMTDPPSVVIEFNSANEILVDSIKWGTTSSYDSSGEKVEGTRDKGSASITIIRRVGVFCIEGGASGGNSWIAVEGG